MLALCTNGKRGEMREWGDLVENRIITRHDLLSANSKFIILL